MNKEIIAGVDEAGRGALAGPVVAGAVILTPTQNISVEDMQAFLHLLDDSKKLTSKQRSELFIIITKYFDYGVGIVSAAEIDAIGIKKSTETAMNQAVLSLKTSPKKLLIDGCDTFKFTIESEDIIKGDEKIPAIAAASIIAKVTRDKLMLRYDEQFPVFGFGSHKGYGSKKHLDLLDQGVYSSLHRKSYDPLKTWLNQGRLF
jgi:ribonuclease HII